MMHQLRPSRIVFFLALALFRNGFRRGVTLTSAIDFSRRQTHTTSRPSNMDSHQGLSEWNVVPPSTPPTASSTSTETMPAGVFDNNPSASQNKKQISRQYHWTSITKLKENAATQTRELMESVLDAARYVWKKRQLKGIPSVGVSQDLMATTRLSGGAEQVQPNQDISEGGDQTPTTSDNQKSHSSSAFLGNLDTLRRRSLRFPKTIVQGNNHVIKKFKSMADVVQQTSGRAVPPFVTTLSILYTSNKGMSAVSLYALALLGASCGFHLFLHFITIGYALGIGLPLSVALYVYSKHSHLPRTTFFHSIITVFWSFRMLAFFIWREYVSWPALHEKVVEIQKKMSIPFASKLLCWLVYSFFYFAMMSMSWSRLQQGMSAKWGIVGFVGLILQVGGLGLETIADLQKNGFKSQNRHAWCNVGVWKWSTHPNYLGEGLFWWGAFLGHGFYSFPHTILATTGLGFIMSVLKGSTRSLSVKHMEKYGDLPDYFEFQRTHSIWGPKQWWWWLHGMEHLSQPKFVPVIHEGNSTTINNSSNSEEVNVSLNGV